MTASILTQQAANGMCLPPSTHSSMAPSNASMPLQESCAAVGVPSSLLSASEVNSSYRQLQLPPHRASALLQPDGGVIRTPQAAAAARQLATNAGVMLRVRGGTGREWLACLLLACISGTLSHAASCDCPQDA